MKQIRSKLISSSLSVFPITLTVLILSLILGIDSDNIIGALLSSLLLIFGMAFFTLGADVAIMPIGELMGIGLTKSRKISLILIASFITGLLVTIAEPGLIVLGQQVHPQINQWGLVIAVGLGVGTFLMIAMIRTLFKIKLRNIFLFFYIIIFIFAAILSIMGKAQLLTVAFDSAGATTGAITVPLIMAFGIGIASIKGDAQADDSFGLIAICSIGPIISVLILSFFSKSGLVIENNTTPFAFENFYKMLPGTISDVLIPLALIVAFFLIFQLLIIRVSLNRLLKIFVGIGYTLIGLILFLLGANVGFMPMGNELGKALAESNYYWVLIPIGVMVGCFIVAAEPSIHVLNAKVEEISDGIIKRHQMLIALMAGIGLSIGLSMIRVIFDLSIWYMIAPCYTISLILMFFCPKVFTAVAFDSGGVASGPMTSAFLLPLAMGACEGMVANGGSGSLIEFAFGVIALVAMTPLVTIQIMGVRVKMKQRRMSGRAKLLPEDEIIYLA